MVPTPSGCSVNIVERMDVWMPKVWHGHPFAVTGDNGMAYLEWGAVPEYLRGEVTGLVCTAYRKHASSRTPDASRQTFPGWQQSPISFSSSSSPQAPGLALGWSLSLPHVPPEDRTTSGSPEILTSLHPPKVPGLPCP